MIQIYQVKAPLGGRSFSDVSNIATDVLSEIGRTHPALLGAWMEDDGGMLHVGLRVQASDRWKTGVVARRAATTLMERCGIDVAQASIELSETVPTRRSLTAAQGRKGTPPVEPEPEAPPRFKGKVNKRPGPKRPSKRQPRDLG